MIVNCVSIELNRFIQSCDSTDTFVILTQFLFDKGVLLLMRRRIVVMMMAMLVTLLHLKVPVD